MDDDEVVSMELRRDGRCQLLRAKHRRKGLQAKVRCK
jgi:hypothetical protein